MYLDYDILNSIQDEWNKAEEAIKTVENIAKDVAIPSIKELRYAGRRLIDALAIAHSKENETKVQALLEDARFCCHRAQHDAIDVVIAKINIDIDNLTSTLGFDAVIDAYPGFREFYSEFNSIHEDIVASRKNRVDRNAIYGAISDVNLPEIAKKYKLLMAARPIAKSNAIKRKLGSINGCLLTFAAIMTMVFVGLAVDWDKYLPNNNDQNQTTD